MLMIMSMIIILLCSQVKLRAEQVTQQVHSGARKQVTEVALFLTLGGNHGLNPCVLSGNKGTNFF